MLWRHRKSCRLLRQNPCRVWWWFLAGRNWQMWKCLLRCCFLEISRPFQDPKLTFPARVRLKFRWLHRWFLYRWLFGRGAFGTCGVRKFVGCWGHCSAEVGWRKFQNPNAKFQIKAECPILNVKYLDINLVLKFVIWILKFIWNLAFGNWKFPRTSFLPCTSFIFIVSFAGKYFKIKNYVATHTIRIFIRGAGWG